MDGNLGDHRSCPLLIYNGYSLHWDALRFNRDKSVQRDSNPGLAEVIGPKSAATEAPTGVAPQTLPHRVFWLALMSCILLISFIGPLGGWLTLCLHESLHSHLLLIPFISGYLVWEKRVGLPRDSRPSPRAATIPLAAAVCLISVLQFGDRANALHLEATLLILLLLFMSCVLALLGKGLLKKIAFPAAFLLLLIPMPKGFEAGIENFFQQASAEVSFLLIKASNITVMQDGLTFHLAGISLHVAPECSGIRSTMILFIASLVAGHFFLRNTWSKTLLSIAVIPIGVIRNALRITTLANMCVYGNPELIHSPLHSRGGPLFFALSIVPLFFLLVLLRKREFQKP